jgi:hypothetical protein
MTAFEFRITTDLPDTAFVRIDERFDIAIERTHEGLEMRVYPLTDGEIWFEPYDTFKIDERTVIELEQETEG